MRKRCYCVRRRGVYAGPSTNIALRLRWNGLLRHFIPPQSRSALDNLRVHEIFWCVWPSPKEYVLIGSSETLPLNTRTTIEPSNDESVKIIIVSDADRFPGVIV
jgi:hypothetical protein